MSLVLLLAEATESSPPSITRLGLGAVPARRGAAFPLRAPPTILVVDPATWTWQGPLVNAADRLALEPASWRWIGRTVPGQRITGLGLGAVPGRRHGPFPARTPQTVLSVAPAVWTWQGQGVNVPQDDVAPADWGWQGQEVVVRVRGALRPFTRLGLGAVPARRAAPFTDRDALSTGPAVWTWIGQPVTARTGVTLALAPAAWTWQGQLVVPSTSVSAPGELGLYPLAPLSGVR